MLLLKGVLVLDGHPTAFVREGNRLRAPPVGKRALSALEVTGVGEQVAVDPDKLPAPVDVDVVVARPKVRSAFRTIRSTDVRRRSDVWLE